MKIRALHLAALLLAAAPAPALAWGNMGHRMVGQAAMEGLPAAVPAFLRTPAAAAAVGELSREPDRSKGSGKVHDSNRDPGHFVDLEDDGRILGGPRLDALPPTRAEYEAALRAVGQDSWKGGYLPYSIVDQYQQLTTDFAYWRVEMAAEPRQKDKARRAWMHADRVRREQQVLSTIGYLSHFVGDGSQPLHISAHYNGWGDYPNPNGYTTAKVHGPFEEAFVGANVREPAVRAQMTPFKSCGCAIEKRVADYLAVAGAQAEPFYQLEKAGGFLGADPKGIAFATVRVAAGASELRDLVAEAWTASAGVKIGWPAVSVADVLAGKADPYEALYGRN
ncbi:S1/P1 Nuclease [Phenylobacterium sp. 20VBR1]|uniref:S1/P1 Nuclease n=1 Tax=Phenylobacterium glaciei TaxID=2803784 RepID=A0A941D0M4_9CAUL|nr:S1/P1 Nuclease [Phenylobacterium glaciei]MBR7619357.1 S1/P1 Nuclease [Phenylobacterium glaciei]